MAEANCASCCFLNLVLWHSAFHVNIFRFRLLDFDAIKLYTMPVKRDQGQQRKRKAEAREGEEASSSSGPWSVPFFGWLVRVIPKPTKSKIRTARAILLEQYPNVLTVDSLTTGVCLTLGERRNKYAVSKNIHNLLDSVFPECSMELTPTDGATAPLTVAELKYKGLSTAFGQHFDQDVPESTSARCQRVRPKHILIPSHSLLDSLEVKNDLKLVTDIFNSCAALTCFSVWTTCNSISRGEPPTSA